ncbi:MAG: sensor histidine kinase [Microbacteriaceae bacterium]|nr:sensor histidine kinase [Microbacteriaceae bacterium]
MVDPRWRTILTVAPYVVLGMLAAFTVWIEWGDTRHLALTLGLCAADVVWIVLFRHSPGAWRVHPAVIAVFMAGLVGLNLALVLLGSWFGFLAIATFTFAYSIVPWPGELFAVGATAIVAGIAQASSLASDPAGTFERVCIILLNVIVMCGLSWSLRLAGRQAMRWATETERSRLAREIHDTLAQGFVGIVTQLQAADEAPDDETRRRHSAAALDLAREGLAEARRSVQALRPAALESVRLTDALGTVTRAWSARTGIPVRLSTSGDARSLSVDVEVALLRTAQEALANVEHHAVARAVELTLRSDTHGTRLEVRDDGRGFDAAKPATGDGGYGLIAMRERLESVAGSLVIESRPGDGTAVRAEVPA